MAAGKECLSVANNAASFLNGGRQLFIENCNKIENDNNFRPDVSDIELLALVIDEFGQVRPHGKHEALVIEKIEANPKSPFGELLGNLYHVRVALKYLEDYKPVLDEHGAASMSDVNNRGNFGWHVDDSVIIYARVNGTVTFHNYADVCRGDMKRPVDHLSLAQFLNNFCLHPPKEAHTTPTP